MTTAPTTPEPHTDNQLALVFQYTVEAYKAFQKFAELLPNPVTAAMFANFARDERKHRDLIEIKYANAVTEPIPITLAGDLRFQDALEGELNYREITEMLIMRERTMEKRLRELTHGSSEADRNLYTYMAFGKRAHVALLERELQMIGHYPDWFKREDAESLIVYGAPAGAR